LRKWCSSHHIPFVEPLRAAANGGRGTSASGGRISFFPLAELIAANSELKRQLAGTSMLAGSKNGLEKSPSS
jgi:hypothetical protein